MVDITKAHQYINNVAEIESFIKERKNKVKDQEIYSEALQEAKTAGAYSGLQDFINSLPCISPGVRNKFTDYLKDLTREFNLSLKAEELLNNTPDCPSEGTTTVTLRPNFFAWLTQPFKLNLAQTTQLSSEEENPSIAITPALQETEDSIELSNLENLSASIIEKAQEKEEERKKEIGEVWPVEECSKEIVDKNINGGHSMCLEYSTLISGKDMEKFKQELSLNNPLNNQAQSIDFFQSLLPFNLTQIGITTSSISTSSDLFAALGTTTTDTTTIKQLINQYCANYNVGPSERGESNSTDTNKIQTAYTACLQEFTNQYDLTTKLLQKEIEDKKNEVEENKKYIENLIASSSEIQASIDPSVCPGAYEDLENITQSLETKNGLYTNLEANLNDLSIQLTGLRSLINQVRSNLFSIIDEVFASISDILPFLDINLEQLIKDLINQLISYLVELLLGGIHISLPILDKIKIGPLKIDKETILNKLLDIVSNLDKVLDPLARIFLNYKKISYELYKSNFTMSSFLNDVYDFHRMYIKLDAYNRAVLRGECSSGGNSSGISLIKNQVIVVESKKEQNKSFNFFALLKNIFAPKIVEIRNEK